MIQLRELSNEDFDSYAELWRSAIADRPDRFGMDKKTLQSVDEQKLRRIMSAVGTSWFIGAFEGKDLIGFVGLRRVGSSEISLWGLYVRPKWRRQGVGRMLCTEVLNFCHNSKADCWLSALRSDPELGNFYRDLGFNEDEALTMKVLIDGNELQYSVFKKQIS